MRNGGQKVGMMKNKIILLISPEPWGTNFVSKHHYANYLAKNNIVYFLNPPLGFSKRPFSNVKCRKKEVKPGLIVLDYVNLLPKLNHLPKWIQSKTYKEQAKQIQSFINVKELDIIWSFDPFRFYNQRNWSAKTTIYHTVDFHPKATYEKDIVLNSDHFFGVADLILKEHSSYRNGILVSHAADIDGFHIDQNIQLPGRNKIRAIYTGNFHKHINYNLLKQLITSHPECDFIMVGPTKNSNLSSANQLDDSTLKALRKLDNIFFIGSVKPSLLMAHLMKCDINLVLFKKENEIIHCSPHKLMAYFYSSNITLSNFIHAHKDTSKEIIEMVNSEQGILTKFSEIIDNLSYYNSASLKHKRRLFAEANSYENKIKEIETYILE